MPGDALFVPTDFEPPLGLTSGPFVLRPLEPSDNEHDYEAWTSSVEHIRSTPGFAGRDWPHAMAPADNLRDLEMHALDFERRRGFTYTVTDPERGDTIGCVYLYPSEDPDVDVDVRSWVRASRADLDRDLYLAVGGWLARSWPWTAVAYAARP